MTNPIIYQNIYHILGIIITLTMAIYVLYWAVLILILMEKTLTVSTVWNKFISRRNFIISTTWLLVFAIYALAPMPY